jgi:hypothetical protein
MMKVLFTFRKPASAWKNVHLGNNAATAITGVTVVAGDFIISGDRGSGEDLVEEFHYSGGCGWGR